MQLLVQDASELFMAITLIIGAIALVNFTRKRTAGLSPEESTSAGRPLYFSAVGIVVLAIASLYNFVIDLETSPLMVNGTYYVLTLIAATLFAIAALMILDYKKAIGISVVTLVIGTTITYLIAILELPIALGMMAGPISLILNLIPIGLFIYLAKNTGRITAIALAFLLVTYLVYPLTATSTDPSLIAALVGIRLLGPALIILAFFKPELGVSVELFGYTVSLNIISFWFSYALTFGIADVGIFIGIALISVVSLLGFTSGTYALSRYRASRNNATGLIGLYFISSAIGNIIVSLIAIGAITGATNDYLTAVNGLIGMMFFNLSAFVALDWKRTSLLPILLTVPALVYLVISFPTAIALISGYSLVSGITNILQIIVPVSLYTMLWWKMRKAGAPGRSRPLFLTIGLVLLMIGGTVAMITTGDVQQIVALLPASILLVSFTVFLVGITGYADKWLGTAKPEA
ncbi:MAG: hypothetical protein RTV31_02140 [Candidatus Thorarchaeota archaeon]